MSANSTDPSQFIFGACLGIAFSIAVFSIIAMCAGGWWKEFMRKHSSCNAVKTVGVDAKSAYIMRCKNCDRMFYQGEAVYKFCPMCGKRIKHV